MKSMIFTEFIEMVESDLGFDIADQMFGRAAIANDGAYTSVGTYDHAELIALVVSLSQVTKTPVPDLVKVFGGHLFRRLGQLYPEAELPTFECNVADGGVFEMTYHSSRPFADLAEGMIAACIEHFQDQLILSRLDLGDQDGTEAKFTLSPAHAEVSVHEREICPN